MAIINNHSRPGQTRIPIAQRTPGGGAYTTTPKPATPTTGGFKLATDLAGLEAQRRDPANNANRAQLSTAIAAARRAQTPQVAPPLQEPAPQPAPAPAPAPAPQPDPNAGEALFPSARNFTPKDYEGDPLYQFQLKQGQKALGSSLAAKGLRNSGAAIEQELDLPLRLAAQNSERMNTNAQKDADRYAALGENEANRLERREDAGWRRAYDWTSLGLDQSPWAQAYSGLGSLGDLNSAEGKSLAQAIMASVSGGGGGGRGGGGSTPFVAPPPGQPNYINTNPNNIFGDASSSAGYGSIVSDLLASIFPKKAT